MMMPGRKYSADNLYRFGFNGKENDNEVNGEGSSLDFGARIYDPRIVHWLSVDPLFGNYPHQSPYVAMSNNPINRIDPTGMGDHYTKDGKRLGNDGKTVTQGKGKKAKQVDDNKAYITTQEDFDANTKDGVTNWDAILASSNTKELSVNNSTLNIFANTVAEESSGDKEESFAIASVINRLSNIKRKDILATIKTEGIMGYKNGGNSSKYKNNAEYSMGAAINALTGGYDFSNGAVRWDGDDFGKKGFSHDKPTFAGIEITVSDFEAYKKAYSAMYSNFSNNLSAGIHVATSNGWHNLGKCLYISTAVHGRTIFWGPNRDPVLKRIIPIPFPIPHYILFEDHVNKGYKGWSGL